MCAPVSASSHSPAPDVGDRVAHERAELFVEPIVLLPRAAFGEEFPQRPAAAQLGYGAEAHHAVVGEARHQTVDVSRHEQRLRMGDERARLLDGAWIAAVLLAHS